MSPTDEGPNVSTDDLKVALSQKVDGSLHVTVSNSSPSVTYTILRRDSPLDGLMLQLGLLSVIPAGTTEKLEVPRIMVNRIWPPLPEELVSLKPGENTDQEIFAFLEPIINMDDLKRKGGGKATIQLSGKWSIVWIGACESWAETEGLPRINGVFESSILEIAID